MFSTPIHYKKWLSNHLLIWNIIIWEIVDFEFLFFSFGNFVNWNDETLCTESVKYCLEHGINFFDTAEVYGFGKAETLFWKAFKTLNVPREKIVVSTKLFLNGPDPNDGNLSRKHIIEGLRLSLQKLQMDYVDVVFCHKYDRYTPL